MRRPVIFAVAIVAIAAVAAGTFALGPDDAKARIAAETEAEKAASEKFRAEMALREERWWRSEFLDMEERRVRHEEARARADFAQGEQMGRHHHLLRAAEHLDAAGIPDLAARLRHAAGDIERDAFDPNAPERSDDLTRHVREISQGLRRMNQRMDELSATVERLDARVGEMGR